MANSVKTIALQMFSKILLSKRLNSLMYFTALDGFRSAENNSSISLSYMFPAVNCFSISTTSLLVSFHTFWNSSFGVSQLVACAINEFLWFFILSIQAAMLLSVLSWERPQPFRGLGILQIFRIRIYITDISKSLAVKDVLAVAG